MNLLYWQLSNTIYSGNYLMINSRYLYPGKQIWVVLQRALTTVRKEPAQLVTALRIIEREERADQFVKQVSASGTKSVCKWSIGIGEIEDFRG